MRRLVGGVAGGQLDLLSPRRVYLDSLYIGQSVDLCAASSAAWRAGSRMCRRLARVYLDSLYMG